MTPNQNNVGCIDKLTYGQGNAHQLQFWLHLKAHGYEWEVRNAYVPGGNFVRSCQLDCGSNPDYDKARSAGQEKFDRLKTEELAKVPATAAVSASAPAVS